MSMMIPFCESFINPKMIKIMSKPTVTSFIFIMTHQEPPKLR